MKSSSAEKNEKEATGVARWRQGDGARRKRRRRGLSRDARAQIPALVVALLLLVGAVVACLPPAERLGWGADFAGGTSYTFVSDADADLSSAVGTVRDRLAALDVRGARVSAADGQLTVQVPAGEDDAAAVAEVARTGRFELVRLDSISDADALARISAGVSDVELAEGTYEAFLDGSSVTAASAVETSSGSGVYGLALSFDSEGAQAFADVTGELAPVYGQIAVVVDGTVVAAPQVSQAIEGGQVSISLSLTQTEAAGIAAAISTGELPCSLVQQGSSAFSAAVGADELGRALVVAGVAVLALLVVLLVWMRLLGLVAYAGLVYTAVLEVGGLALLSSAGVFVPTVTAYLGAAVAVLVAFCAQLLVVARVRSRMRSGTDARDALRSAPRSLRIELGTLAAVFVVGGLVLYFVVSDGGLATSPAGLAWPVAAVVGALSLALVVLPLGKLLACGPLRDRDAAGARDAKRDED